MHDNRLFENFLVICNRQIVQRANYHKGSRYMRHVTLLDRTISIGYYVETDSLGFWPDQKARVIKLARYEILTKLDSTDI